jgi:mannose-6-phosphate isomerase
MQTGYVPSSPYHHIFLHFYPTKALPLQIHPDKKLAAELHARDPSKFVDANHKPEIACALTPFLGFAGFAPYANILKNITGIPEVKAFLEQLPSYSAFVQEQKEGTLKPLVKDILGMNQKSSGILETAKDALKAVTGTQEPPKERGGGDAQGVVKSLIERIDAHGPGSVFTGQEWDEDQKRRISVALKKTQEFYAGDPGIIVAWYVPRCAGGTVFSCDAD